MKTLISNVITMSERELLAVIGVETHGTLLTIDHTYLNYGEHYTFNQVTIYNEAGLKLIAEKLKEWKLEKESYCLTAELDQRRNTPSRRWSVDTKPRAHWFNKGVMA